ncbi:MAG: hypothetical protein IVW52_05015 [Acidimicrobiales bacterium]|nr:hypothetical protein [Acidimicrobiales bacterium]
MRVLLVDHDSTIPNLALMQLAAWHRVRGDSVALSCGMARPEVPLDAGKPDRAYVSCVFSWNRPTAEAVARGLSRACPDVRLGGSGVDWGKPAGAWSTLPADVDATLPDYDLYGDDRAIGFCQRGCIRACDFCLVSRKEGAMSRYPFRHPRDWVPSGLSKVLLLDNEFAAHPPALQRDVIGWFRDSGRRYSITQGYDARILAGPPKGEDHGEELAGILADHKPWSLKFDNRKLYIAWDYIGIEPQVRRAVPRLLRAGFDPKEITCYILSGHPPKGGRHPTGDPCGYADGGHSCGRCHDEVRLRFDVLWGEFGVHPFVMRDNMRTDDPWLNRFARYVNRGPASFRNHTFEAYLERHPVGEAP